MWYVAPLLQSRRSRTDSGKAHATPIPQYRTPGTVCAGCEARSLLGTVGRPALRHVIAKVSARQPYLVAHMHRSRLRVRHRASSTKRAVHRALAVMAFSRIARVTGAYGAQGESRVFCSSPPSGRER